ncbi:MAG TPA: ATP-binding cassette domain-containing protein [Gemmatimonadaceae bacterium]
MDDDPCADRPLSDTILALRDITKRFGDMVALDTVSLSAGRGRITALLGENGAGKTTLMRIAFGMLQPDSGSIEADGRPVRFSSPADAIAAGIGMVHQQFSLIPAMTVAENVALAGRGKYSLSDTKSRLREIAKRTGLQLDPDSYVADLGSADRQKLEILRTLAHQARVLILDEPTAVLTPKDTIDLFDQLKSFADDGGAVILITHKLADAIEHADDVTVLRRGKLVMSDAMSEVDEAGLVAAMLGSIPERSISHANIPNTKGTVASIDRMLVMSRRGGEPVEVSLDVRGGEILGVAALDGAAIPILRALAKRVTPRAASISLPERIGFVPENRRDEALIDEFSLTENAALSGAGSRKGVIDWESVVSRATQIISGYNVVTRGVEASPGNLSGGNQQRFVLGRELEGEPALIVLENPTQGLDVNAAAFVHDRLRIARDNGAAVVFYSSDLDELAELADRVIVVSQSGLRSVNPDKNEIGAALLGTHVG